MEKCMPEDNENKIRTARRNDWKTEPMPEQHEVFVLRSEEHTSELQSRE